MSRPLFLQLCSERTLPPPTVELPVRPSFQDRRCPCAHPASRLSPPPPSLLTHPCPLKGWELYLQAPLCPPLPLLLPTPQPCTCFVFSFPESSSPTMGYPESAFPPGLSLKIYCSLVWTHSPTLLSRSFNFTGQHLTWRNVLITLEFQTSGVGLVSSIWPGRALAGQEFGTFRRL